MTEIVSRDNPILRKKTQDIKISEIASSKIQKIISRMKKALDSQDDGVAIAAPQIGEPYSIFVISPKVFGELKEYSSGNETASPKNAAENENGEIDAASLAKNSEHLVFINPKIVKLSKQKKMSREGCLSVRWLYGKVKRSTKAAVRAYDEKGNKFERGGSRLLAQIFQHETDHLKGVIFTDKASVLQNLPPENSPTELKKSDGILSKNQIIQ
ncbi:MAG: hypothetical protein A3G59_02790 [Candidatus Taylorbacteria bacterium RIFCSPLOWO2_12_FULL_47_20]|uniref:Peptide deformylase n=2 Tax=Candidatus Tayloriibacteriota TaxID=1817919 RepID=A0A1G2P6T3_9BACT|nr:MAG: hypothetical protein A3H68_00735 [Candidatus Taylorbacteria bacterium RIFCSPLOWO2_02_FULL_46_40]OHA43281.1 MAG: hypothetical protein A3G59_02790 [Candidatus Taylorbacteria bacterium RIFCSPLOWO2_12_FULL_47_20]